MCEDRDRYAVDHCVSQAISLIFAPDYGLYVEVE